MGPEDDIVPGSTRRSKLFLDRTASLVARYNSHLVWFLVCFGCLGTFAALPFVPTHPIGTDEKALIIGSLGSQFDLVVNGSRRAVDVARQLISKHGTLDGEGVGLDGLVARADALRRRRNEIPETSDETMDDINVRTIRWQSTGWSSGVNAPPASSCAGTWTYTRIHGGRGDGTESLLLVFVIDEATKPSEMALTIALAIESTLILRSAPWLAKDIYVAIVQARRECSRSRATREWVSSSSLGLPQQGLVIELESTTVSEVYLDVIGYNGQLPNLDMVALMTKNIETFSHLAFRGERASFVTALRNNFISMTRLADPILKRAGAHAVLLQNSIDALTLHFTGPRHEENDRSVAGATRQTLLEMEILTARQVLFIAEMVMRSCNNLQERLHHASSLYFLVGQRKAVSIGIYLLIPGSLLIALLVQWTALQQQKHNQAPFKKPQKLRKTSKVLLLMWALLVCGGWWVTAEKPLDGLKGISMLIKALRAIDFGTLMLVAVIITGIWRSGACWNAFVLEVAPHKKENKEEQTNCNRERSRTSIKLFLCSVLFVISAALLLLRWASCTFLLLTAVPLLQLL